MSVPKTSLLIGLHDTFPQLRKEVLLHNSVHILIYARNLLPTLIERHEPNVLVCVFSSSSICSRNKPHADFAGFQILYSVLDGKIEVSKGGDKPSEALLVGSIVLVW